MSVRSKPSREVEAPSEPERGVSELPDGWATATLRELVDVLDSRRIPINSDERAKRLGGVPYFGATGQVGWIDDFLFDEEILLIGEDGAPFFDKSKPIAYIVRGKSWVNNHAHVLQANDHVTSNLYLKYFLDWFDFNGFVNGTTRLKLTQAAMNSIPVRVAPLAEQRRIVGKLELLLGKVSSSQQRLSRVPGLLKRFRQSVLAAACSGKLTADWREENETDETGEMLLSRIKAERLKLAKTAKETNQIEAAFESGGPEVTDEELGFDTLPESWKTCRIGAAGTVCNGSTPSRQQPSFWEGNIPWVSSGEVRNNIITNTREAITKAGFEETSVRLLPRGTVLIAMIGEGKTRGQSAILEIEATINQNIAAVDISHGFIDPKFLWRWFQMRYEATREQGSGSGPQALNCQRVRELPFVLPPLAEQQEIVRRVEKLFAFADQIESRLRQAQAHVDRLT